MKTFQQNLLVALACALCGLCAYQWYNQTFQRNQIQRLNQVVYDRSVAIRDYTNSIATLNHQIAQMDTELSELRQTVKSNQQVMVEQKVEINRLQAANESFSNAIVQYTNAVATLETKLKEAYAGIQKQNDSLNELVAQRDEFVKKYNDSVKDRNEVVAKYNDLAAQVKKLQGAKE